MPSPTATPPSLTIQTFRSGRIARRRALPLLLIILCFVPAHAAWCARKPAAAGSSRVAQVASNAGLAVSTESAARAAERIRASQHPDGYWRTPYTSGTRFEQPVRETNTFMTALLIDLLDPVAKRAGLSANLARARKYLTAQIEADGLVRYHGLPTPGWVITPDADDTALTWRIAASPDRQKLTAALTTLARYRRNDGLYKTWLAPRDAYRGINPGLDPNPADIGIQMHVLQLLSAVQPKAATALCDALRPRLDDDSIWTYYRRTPLVAMLRLPDLARAGCPLSLPQSRMRSDIEGQEVWISVVRLLTVDADKGSASARAARARQLLRDLAKDDFAAIRTSPPLLYHNDLTASISRYYWSEDVGYALWLQLYDRTESDGL